MPAYSLAIQRLLFGIQTDNDPSGLIAQDDTRRGKYLSMRQKEQKYSVNFCRRVSSNLLTDSTHTQRKPILRQIQSLQQLPICRWIGVLSDANLKHACNRHACFKFLSTEATGSKWLQSTIYRINNGSLYNSSPLFPLNHTFVTFKERLTWWHSSRTLQTPEEKETKNMQII